MVANAAAYPCAETQGLAPYANPKPNIFFSPIERSIRSGEIKEYESVTTNKGKPGKERENNWGIRYVKVMVGTAPIPKMMKPYPM